MGKNFNRGDIPAAADFNGFSQLVDLAAAAGSSIGSLLIGFLASTTAVARTVYHKLKETPSVRDFGVLADGSATNDLVALNKAIAALNSGEITSLFFPGWVTINGALDPITAPGVTLYALGRRHGGIRQAGSFDTLWFKSLNPSTTQTYDIQLRSFGIEQTIANPTAGVAVRLTRVFRAYLDLELRGVFAGVLTEGGDGHVYDHPVWTTNSGWSAVAVGSYLLKITNYAGTTEVPSEISVVSPNIKGNTIPAYLEKGMIIQCGDGIWTEGGHLGFTDGPSVSIEAQANAALYFASIKFTGTYIDGSFGGNAASSGVSISGSTLPTCGDIEFNNAKIRGWAGVGVKSTLTTLSNFRLVGKTNISSNGKQAISLTGASYFTLNVECYSNNRSNGAFNAVDLSACTKGDIQVSNYVGAFTHPVGLSIDATCSDLTIDKCLSEGNTGNSSFSVAAGAARITFGSSNLLVGGNVQVTAADPLVIPIGYKNVIVSGNTNFNTVTGAGQVNEEVTLWFSGTPTIATGVGNVQAMADFVAAPNSSLQLRYDGSNWRERGRSGTAASMRTAMGLGALATTVPGAGIAAFLTTPNSANLAAAVTDDSGTAGTLPFQSIGTFTPTLTLGGAAVGLTYTTQFGDDIRIGNVVFFRAVIVVSALGSSTGAAQINGLPFTSTATQQTSVSILISSGAAGLGSSMLMADVNSASNTIRLSKLSSGTRADLTNADLSATSRIQISGCYPV